MFYNLRMMLEMLGQNTTHIFFHLTLLSYLNTNSPEWDKDRVDRLLTCAVSSYKLSLPDESPPRLSAEYILDVSQKGCTSSYLNRDFKHK